MRVTRLGVRDFRTHADVDVRFGPGLNVIHGPNGAGKTNLLEALYFGCTGRSCRTTNERECVRFGARVARVELTAEDRDGEVALAVGFEPGAAKRMSADGAAVERLVDLPRRPLVCVFMPDRLELVKGPPSIRRAHIDQLVAALWPARAVTRSAYAQALAQRNALLTRVRAGHAPDTALRPWTTSLARHGFELMQDRDRAVGELAGAFAGHAAELGLAGDVQLSYRPRSRADSAAALEAELEERLGADLQRGFTSHGPHRDDLGMGRDGRDLRAYGSQGEQRLALLALLLAERAAIAAERAAPPVMLLDDVMSELDAARRERLVAVLRGCGQAILTTTDLAHVPDAGGDEVARIAVADGRVLQEVRAA